MQQAIYRRIEQQAHRFARAFLLPLPSFADDLFGVSLDAFRALKPKWNASIAMMIFRARDAGLAIQEAEREAADRHQPTQVEDQRTLRRHHANRGTPPLAPLLRPKDLNERAQTAADVTTRIGLPTSDIEALSALPGISTTLLR